MYNPTRPERVKFFLENFCKQSKYPWTGKPLILLPWQWEELIKPLYGTMTADGEPQFTQAGIWIPKKNGKSTLCSGLSLYHLLEYPGSEVYTIASDVMQAGIIFLEAANMVEASPALRSRLRVRRNIKVIEDRKNNSFFKVLSGAPTGKSGFSANYISYDELADWPKHSARDKWDQLKDATIARPNSIQMVISTAQYDKETLGYEQYLKAKRIKEIRAANAARAEADKEPDPDPTFLPIVYEVPEHADWTLEENWWAANPSAGVTVPKKNWRDKFTSLQSNPIETAQFRTLRLNQWIGHADSWIEGPKWNNCALDFTEESLHGKVGYIGIDMARKYDLAAYVVMIKDGDLVYVMPRFFIPKVLAKRYQERDNVLYLSKWAATPAAVAKYKLYLTPGDVIDPGTIREHIEADCKNFKIRELRFDPSGMEETRQILAKSHKMVEVTQYPTTMGKGVAHFERLIETQRLRHPNNDILNWNLGNTVVKLVGDNIMLDKQRATARIDGISACCIAATGLLAHKEFYKGTILTV